MLGFSDGFTGLFKVATGEDISKSEKPGMFDLKVRRPLQVPQKI
jgi:acyl-CoA-binding protein